MGIYNINCVSYVITSGYAISYKQKNTWQSLHCLVNVIFIISCYFFRVNALWCFFVVISTLFWRFINYFQLYILLYVHITNVMWQVNSGGHDFIRFSCPFMATQTSYWTFQKIILLKFWWESRLYRL